MATDYKNYALVYGCDNWGPIYTNEAWILSRNRTLPDSVVTYLKNILAS